MTQRETLLSFHAASDELFSIIYHISPCLLYYPGAEPNIQSEDASAVADANPDTDGGAESDSRASDHRLGKRAQPRQSFSDAEIDYRRARSLREANAQLAWRNTLP